MNAPVRCPVCAAAARPRVRLRDHRYLGCDVCGHGFLDAEPAPDHVRTTFDDAYFSGAPGGYDDYLASRPLVERRGAHYLRVVARHGLRSGRMLDAGCGAGFIAGVFRDAGWDVAGLEPNPRMAALAADRCGGPVSTSPLEEARFPEPFDLILLIQVAAHLVRPDAAFASLARLLRPGGLLVVETWDGRSLTARLLGPSWHEHNPPSVLHVFCPMSLRLLAARHGLRHEATRRTFKSVPAGMAASLLRAKAAASPALRLPAFLASSFPPDWALPYPADDLFHAVFRQPR
jgi:SAM-dependent methyltransferase